MHLTVASQPAGVLYGNYLTAQINFAMNFSSPPAKILHKPEVQPDAGLTGVTRLQSIPRVPTQKPNKWSKPATNTQVKQQPVVPMAAPSRRVTASPSRIPQGAALPKAKPRGIVPLKQTPWNPANRTLEMLPTRLPPKGPMAKTGRVAVGAARL